jgi:hypothetical protein
VEGRGHSLIQGLTQNFSLAEEEKADPEAIYKLYVILEIVIKIIS